MKCWTPAITFDTPGNLSVAYTYAEGNIERSVDNVRASWQILAVPTFSTASGGIRISLPYKARGGISFGSLVHQGITKSGYGSIVPRVQSGVAYADLLATNQGQSITTINATDISSGSALVLWGSISYGIKAFPTGSPVAAFIGDSTTYVRPLSSHRDNIVNAGISGNTTKMMRARFQADVLGLTPSIVHIHGGVNDLGNTDENNAPIDTMANITWMAAQARDAGAKVILATLPPVDWASIENAVTNGGVDRWQGLLLTLNDKIRKLALDQEYLLADYYSTMLLADGTQDKTLFVDTTHENELGSDAMWNVVAPYIK